MSEIFIRLQVIHAEELTEEAINNGKVLSDDVVSIGDASSLDVGIKAGKLALEAKKLVETA